jgi:hypothetical protein
MLSDSEDEDFDYRYLPVVGPMSYMVKRYDKAIPNVGTETRVNEESENR